MVAVPLQELQEERLVLGKLQTSSVAAASAGEVASEHGKSYAVPCERASDTAGSSSTICACTIGDSGATDVKQGGVENALVVVGGGGSNDGIRARERRSSSLRRMSTSLSASLAALAPGRSNRIASNCSESSGAAVPSSGDGAEAFDNNGRGCSCSCRTHPVNAWKPADSSGAIAAINSTEAWSSSASAALPKLSSSGDGVLFRSKVTVVIPASRASLAISAPTRLAPSLFPPLPPVYWEVTVIKVFELR